MKGLFQFLDTDGLSLWNTYMPDEHALKFWKEAGDDDNTSILKSSHMFVYLQGSGLK